jgi:hypothetical protein
MINIHYRYKVDYINPDKQETEYFRKTPTIEFMEQDPDLFRILPVGELFNDNYWCYFNESIGGYSPIKMYTIEEIVTNNLYAGWDTTIPINPNILKILNVRYLVSKMELNRSDLILSHIDSRTNHRVYQYRDFQPRGFFVGETITIPDEYERLETLNREDFDAAKTAIIEEELADNIELPDSSRVNISEYSVDHIKFSIYSDSQSLFVMSVPYYPPGWKALLDGQPVAKVYKTDHAIQSIIVPPGEHAVTLRFEPDSYYNNLAISYASMSLIYLLILAGLLYHHRERLVQITGKQGSNSA